MFSYRYHFLPDIQCQCMFKKFVLSFNLSQSEHIKKNKNRTVVWTHYNHDLLLFYIYFLSVVELIKNWLLQDENTCLFSKYVFYKLYFYAKKAVVHLTKCVPADLALFLQTLYILRSCPFSLSAIFSRKPTLLFRLQRPLNCSRSRLYKWHVAYDCGPFSL